MIDVKCDVCGRSCGGGYTTLTLSTDSTSYGAMNGEHHLCLPTSGGDVGCAQYLREALKWIKEQQEARRHE